MDSKIIIKEPTVDKGRFEQLVDTVASNVEELGNMLVYWRGRVKEEKAQKDAVYQQLWNKEEVLRKYRVTCLHFIQAIRDCDSKTMDGCVLKMKELLYETGDLEDDNDNSRQ